MDNNINEDKIKKHQEILKKRQLEIVKAEILKDKEENKLDKLKPWKWPAMKRREMEESLKKPDMILVFLINLKKVIEGPILAKIYGGNFLVIRNHVYRFNPDRVLSFGKYKAVIAREFDRELVGIDDYKELVEKDMTSQTPGDRVNINDPVLIKAMINAKLQDMSAPKKEIPWLLIGIGIVAVIAVFFIFSGQNPTPKPA